MLAWMSLHQPMNKIGIRKDPRVKEPLIRIVNQQDPLAQSISTSRLGYCKHGQTTRDVVLRQ